MKISTAATLMMLGIFSGVTAFAAESDNTQVSSVNAVAPAGNVARASFTSGIVEREPTDSITTLSNDQNQIYYFTEIQNMAGGTVTHRWEYNGEVMAEIPFNIGGARWRVYSSKNLDPQWLGEWKVSTIDAGGNVLSVNTFSYTSAMPPAQSAPESGEAVQP